MKGCRPLQTPPQWIIGQFRKTSNQLEEQNLNREKRKTCTCTRIQTCKILILRPEFENTWWKLKQWAAIFVLGDLSMLQSGCSCECWDRRTFLTYWRGPYVQCTIWGAMEYQSAIWGTVGTMDHGPCTMYYVLWIMYHGPWTMDFGLWTMDYGLWTMDYGLWNMDYELWTVDYGLRTMNHGLWTMDYGPCTMDHVTIIRHESDANS